MYSSPDWSALCIGGVIVHQDSSKLSVKSNP
jgi:hypothetical protein